jgi:hypothetical protein
MLVKLSLMVWLELGPRQQAVIELVAEVTYPSEPLAIELTIVALLVVAIILVTVIKPGLITKQLGWPEA